MTGPEDNPYDECETCRNCGFIKDEHGNTVPCPDCNADFEPFEEETEYRG
jgi:rubrerythrin